jgi:hypothetical protein
MSNVVGLWVYFIGCALVMVLGITLAALDNQMRGRDFAADRALETWATATIMVAICWPGLAMLALIYCAVCTVAWLGFNGFGLLVWLAKKVLGSTKSELKKGGSSDA